MPHHRGLPRCILQTAFSILYRFGGRFYDPLATFLFGPAWDEWRRTAIKFAGEGPTLDLGCGTGKLLEHLRQRSIQAIGVDRSTSMLRMAARRIGRRHLVLAEAAHLPFLDGVFVSCVATFPAPFILEQRVLDEIARVLRPGGVLVIMFGGENGSSARPWPVRQMLRFVYGRARPLEVVTRLRLDRPTLQGDWKLVTGAHGTALLWLAIKQDT